MKCLKQGIKNRNLFRFVIVFTIFPCSTQVVDESVFLNNMVKMIDKKFGCCVLESVAGPNGNEFAF